MAEQCEGKHLPYDEGKRYFEFADSQGKIHTIDTQQIRKSESLPKMSTSSVKLLLFTRKNPNSGQEIIFGGSDDIYKTNLVKSKPTKFLIHGWTCEASSPFNVAVKNAFLAALDVNVIVIDWSWAAKSVYPIACGYVYSTGVLVASAMDWLLEKGLSIANMHIVGHSLGAHVAGTAARSIKRGRIPYLTGLDPAMPGWHYYTCRITPNDADYVEVIHTSTMGLGEPLGHNDFFPNYPWGQPGCHPINPSPSHNRAWELFACSLDNKRFKASQCYNYGDLFFGSCATGVQLHMGGSKPKSKEGIFYLKTSDKKPFYLG